MTVITHTVLRVGTEPEWDAAMGERLAAASGRQGWIGGQLLIPLERLNERLIVGTWDTRADWEAWHARHVPGNASTPRRARGASKRDDLARSRARAARAGLTRQRTSRRPLVEAPAGRGCASARHRGATTARAASFREQDPNA